MQDRKIEIISVEPAPRRSIKVGFKITDPNPNARYNVRAYLQSPETKDSKEIDVLHNGLEAKPYSMYFNTKDKEGKNAKDGTYYLILGAVTILNGRPFTIQDHWQIRLGKPAKPEAEPKAAERRIQIIDFGWDDAQKMLWYTIKIISTPPLNRPYSLTPYFKPVGEGKWKQGPGYNDQNPKDTQWTGGVTYTKPVPGKYLFYIEVVSGDIRIRSDIKEIEIKTQPTKKAEEFQVILKEVKPDEANYMSKGIPVGTVVDYQLKIQGGEPRFEIKTFVINPNGTTRDLWTDSSDLRDFAHWAKPLFPGATKINIEVKDKTGKTARTQIVIFAK